MREFKVAAKEAAGETEEVIEIVFGERTLVSRIPTSGQVALFYDRLASTSAGDDEDSGAVAAVFGLLRGVLAPGDVPYLKQLLQDRRIGFDVLLGGDEEGEGLVDALMAEYAGRPTTPSTDSSASPESTGRKSTGRSPGKGSTRSASPSTAS